MVGAGNAAGVTLQHLFVSHVYPAGAALALHPAGGARACVPARENSREPKELEQVTIYAACSSLHFSHKWGASGLRLRESASATKALPSQEMIPDADTVYPCRA